MGTAKSKGLPRCTAHRDCLSETSQVGIEVVIEYEDGSTESRFIDLY